MPIGMVPDGQSGLGVNLMIRGLGHPH